MNGRKLAAAIQQLSRTSSSLPCKRRQRKCRVLVNWEGEFRVSRYPPDYAANELVAFSRCDAKERVLPPRLTRTTPRLSTILAAVSGAQELLLLQVGGLQTVSLVLFNTSRVCAVV